MVWWVTIRQAAIPAIIVSGTFNSIIIPVTPTTLAPRITIIRVAFGRAGWRGDLSTCRIDQHRCRHAECATDKLEFLLGSIAALDAFGVIVSAPGADVDFVSRFFVPGAGVPEDPVTGSAHCTLTPYWSARLGKTSLAAKQLSQRGGELHCELKGDRVLISGNTVEYLRGEISVP